MSGTSPASVLFSSDGYELAVVTAASIPAGTRGLLVEGSDGTNSRFLTVDSSGRVTIVGAGVAGTPAGGVVSIQGVAGGTAVPISGSVSATFLSVGLTGATAPTSADLGGALVSTTTPSGYVNGNMQALSMTTTGLLRVDGSNVTQPVSGTVTANAGTGNFTVVQATAANLNATVVASGNFNNASVSATGAAPPASATYAGASVTTAAPAYTTGQMSALSLTTTGLLRIDGVYPVNATTPTTDITFIGGAVTTAAPSYTTGQLSALSLDTNGNLRTTAIVNKAATSTVTSVAGAASSTSVLASNASRIFAAIYNNTTKNMYVLLGSGTASPTNCTTVLMKGVYWEIPVDYTGAVTAIWDAGVTGSALMTELTP